MLKKLMFIVLLLLIASVAVTISIGSNDDIKMSKVVTFDTETFGGTTDKQLVSRVYVENVAVDTDYDDVRVTVMIPELGLRKQVGPFDLDADTKETRTILIDAIDLADNIKPGEYMARITVTANDNEIRKVRHAIAIVE